MTLLNSSTAKNKRHKYTVKFRHYIQVAVVCVEF